MKTIKESEGKNQLLQDPLANACIGGDFTEVKKLVRQNPEKVTEWAKKDKGFLTHPALFLLAWMKEPPYPAILKHILEQFPEEVLSKGLKTPLLPDRVKEIVEKVLNQKVLERAKGEGLSLS